MKTTLYAEQPYSAWVFLLEMSTILHECGIQMSLNKKTDCDNFDFLFWMFRRPQAVLSAAD